MDSRIIHDTLATVASQQNIDDSQPTIQASVRRCLKAFKRLQTSLEQPGRLYSKSISVLAVVDEIGRFRGWVSNIGALQSDRSSLDYRLRDVPFLFNHTIIHLQDLQSTVTEVSEIISGSNISDETPDFTYDNDSESSVGSEGSSEQQDGQSTTAVPTGQHYYQEIVDIIDSLYKLSMAIRSPHIRNRTTKAEAFTERDSEGRDMSKEFEHYAITRALHEMCTWKNKQHVDDLTVNEKAIAIRLGRANSRRRRQFMYEERHHRKLAKVEPNLEEASGNIMPQSPEGEQDRTQDLNKISKIPTRPRESLSGTEGRTLLSVTTATEYIDLDEASSINRSIISNSEYSGYRISNIEIPAAPDVNSSKDFQCPYCFMILPAKTRRTDLWRKHLMRDLQPYVCIYDSCPMKDILYDTETAWLKHEQWEHSPQWCCDSANHPLMLFPVEDEFKDHMREVHSTTFHEHQLQGLTDASRRSSLMAFNSCPFCGITHESFDTSPAAVEDFTLNVPDLTVQPMIQKNDNRFVVTKSSEELQKHIARHLWHSAMLALPPRDDLDEAKSVSIATYKRAQSEVFDLFDSSIDELNTCQLIEDFKEPPGIPEYDCGSLWERVIEVTRHGEYLGLDDVWGFIWLPDTAHLDVALQVASAEGHISAVKLLLDKGANPDADDEPYGAALPAASLRGHTEIVKLLLDRGANVDTRNRQYGNALRAASQEGHESVVRLLLERGADVNDKDARHALQAATFGRHDSIIKLLLDKGVKNNNHESEHSMSGTFSVIEGGSAWVWYCCECGDGPWMRRTDACPICGRWRCGNCASLKISGPGK